MTARWPLIGRRVELDRIDRALTDGATGVVVFGPAGVGRSRLADEARRLAEGCGRMCRRAVASGSAAAMPLRALAHLLDQTSRGWTYPRSALTPERPFVLQCQGSDGRLLRPKSRALAASHL